MRMFLVAGACAILAFILLNPCPSQAISFSLGDAAQFVILGDANTYETGNNSQIIGNIGIGPGGRLKLSGGPFDLTGNIYFADPVTGTNYITSGTNNISGVVAQNNALVTSALSALNSLYTTALSVYVDPGSTDFPKTSTVNISPGNYNYNTASLNNQTINLSGTASDYIIINIKGELKINHCTFNVSGGIPVDHILWNLIQSGDGGDSSKNLTVGGADTGFDGVFLALDRKISISDNNGTGQFFGGKSSFHDDDYRFVSGVTLTSPPPPVPLPASAFLLGSGLLGLVGFGWRRKNSY